MPFACFRGAAIKKNAPSFRRWFTEINQAQRLPLQKHHFGEPNSNIVNLKHYGLAKCLNNRLHLDMSLDHFHGQGLRFKHVETLSTAPFLTAKQVHKQYNNHHEIIHRQYYNNYEMIYTPKTDVIGIIGYEPYPGCSYNNIVCIEESSGLLCCIKYDVRNLQNFSADPNIEVRYQKHSELQEFMTEHTKKWSIKDMTITKLEGGIHPNHPNDVQYRTDSGNQLIHGFLTISSENSGSFGLAFGTLKPHQTESYSDEVLSLNKDNIFEWPFHSSKKDDIIVFRPRNACLVPRVLDSATQWRYKTNVWEEWPEEWPKQPHPSEWWRYQEWRGAILLKPEETLEEVGRFMKLASFNNPLDASISYGTPTDEEWEDIGQWEEYDKEQYLY
eukprot:118520_1